MRRITSVVTLIILIHPVHGVSSYDCFDRYTEWPRDSSGGNFMPLAFTQNLGQWDTRSIFRAEAGGAILYFCRNEVACLFFRNADELGRGASPEVMETPSGSGLQHHKIEALLIKAQFLEANAHVAVVGEDRLPYNCNYFRGNDPAKWHTDAPNYSSVVYRGLYPGINLRYYGDGKSLKYDFIVTPGADFSDILIKYEGADELGVTPGGDLKAKTEFGPVFEKAPCIYQDIDGRKRVIAGRYVLRGMNTFGFELTEAYDPSHLLVIDPELVYCTYLGGCANDEANDVAIDAKGCAYVTGMVRSYDFPIVDPFDDSLGQYEDIFVTKISPRGDHFVYSTYIGSADPYTGADFGEDIEVDASGCAYITGYAGAADFPIANPYDSTFNGVADAFLLKLSPMGNSLVYSTFLGGSDIDVGYGMALDSTNDVFLVGRTRSADFPTLNAYDSSQNDTSSGWGDVFVSEFHSTGNSLVYSTFIGGGGSDIGLGIACDSHGNAYVGGWTESRDFPRVNPYDNSHAGESDAFVAKLSATGDELIYSTYLGTSERDVVIDIEVDAMDNAYVCGYTEQPGFPTVNAYDNSYNGETDAFITKLAPAGNSLVYSTYLGGSRQEIAYAIELDSTCSAYVTGYTGSPGFPLVDPYDASISGCDVFITRFSPEGNSLLFSTFVGASSYEQGNGIAVANSGEIYVAGYTYSYDFATPNAFDTTFGGPSDGFAFRLSMSESQGAEDSEPLPDRVSLFGNFPNPFNSATVLRFSIAQRGPVSIFIYDIAGRKVADLELLELTAGKHQVLWEAPTLPSGIYFARLLAPGESRTIKMSLVK